MADGKTQGPHLHLLVPIIWKTHTRGRRLNKPSLFVLPRSNWVLYSVIKRIRGQKPSGDDNSSNYTHLPGTNQLSPKRQCLWVSATNKQLISPLPFTEVNVYSSSFLWRLRNWCPQPPCKHHTKIQIKCGTLTRKDMCYIVQVFCRLTHTDLCNFTVFLCV